MVENRSLSVLPVEGPVYDQCHFVGHVDVVPGSPEDGEDHESVLHAMNEECGDSYSDVSTGTIPVRQEKSDQEGESGQSDEDDDTDHFVRQI